MTFLVTVPAAGVAGALSGGLTAQMVEDEAEKRHLEATFYAAAASVASDVVDVGLSTPNLVQLAAAGAITLGVCNITGKTKDGLAKKGIGIIQVIGGTVTAAASVVLPPAFVTAATQVYTFGSFAFHAAKYGVTNIAKGNLKQGFCGTVAALLSGSCAAMAIYKAIPQAAPTQDPQPQCPFRLENSTYGNATDSNPINQFSGNCTA